MKLPKVSFLGFGFLKWPSDWYEGGKAGLKVFFWIAAITFIWCLISYFELFTANFISSTTLLVSVILFAISIPTGIFLRMDILTTTYSTTSEFSLLLALPIVMLNFVFIGAYWGWRKSRQKKDV